MTSQGSRKMDQKTTPLPSSGVTKAVVWTQQQIDEQNDRDLKESAQYSEHCNFTIKFSLSIIKFHIEKKTDLGYGDDLQNLGALRSLVLGYDLFFLFSPSLYLILFLNHCIMSILGIDAFTSVKTSKTLRRI
jgi:hypothetical protein